MAYLDKYPACLGCPVYKYCGTVVGSIELCNSYEEPPEDEYIPDSAPIDLSDGDLYGY